MVASVAPFYRKGGLGSQKHVFRGGRGNSTFRGSRGQANFSRGISRGEADFRVAENEQALHHSGEDESQSSHLTEMFLEPKSLNFSKNEPACLIEIRNLPKTRIQDALDISRFIAKCVDVQVEKIIYTLPSEKWDSLAACVVLLPSNTKSRNYKSVIVEMLHGQVFQDRHLLVSSTSDFQITDWCVKVSNLSSAVTEETLWNFFDSCGKLGMIYLNGNETGSKLEALINFEDFESVDNALKLSGSTLFKSNLKVTKLDPKLRLRIFPAVDLESMLKEFNVSHMTTSKSYYPDGSSLRVVYFPDQESYSKVLKMHGQEWNGEVMTISSFRLNAYIQNPNFIIDYNDLELVFGSSKGCHRPYPRKQGITVLTFPTKIEYDNAFRASPVLINGRLVTLYDSISKIPSDNEEGLVKGMEAENNKQVGYSEKVEVNDDFDQNINEDVGSVIPKSPKGIKKLPKPLSSNTDLKRKRDSTKVSKGGISKGKA